MTFEKQKGADSEKNEMKMKKKMEKRERKHPPSSPSALLIFGRPGSKIETLARRSPKTRISVSGANFAREQTWHVREVGWGGGLFDWSGFLDASLVACFVGRVKGDC